MFCRTSHIANAKFACKGDHDGIKLRENVYVQVAIQMSRGDTCAKNLEDLGAKFRVNLLHCYSPRQNSEPDTGRAEVQLATIVHEGWDGAFRRDGRAAADVRVHSDV